MNKTNRLILHKDRIVRNLEILNKKVKSLKPDSEIYPVIKADGYGLGATELAKIALEQRYSSFIVFSLEEGIKLRKSPTLKNKIKNIYALRGLLKGEEKLYNKYNITPVLNSMEQIDLWKNYANKKSKVLAAALQFETGMNRSGIEQKYVKEIAEKVNDNHLLDNQIKIDFIMSHLACADDKKHPLNKIQLENFKNISEKFPKTIKKSLSASDGIDLGKEFIFDIVRPGVGIHLNPRSNKTNNYTQVWEYFTDIKKINTKEKTVHINTGYLDGYYSKIAKNKGYVAINGKKYPVKKVCDKYSVIKLGTDILKIKGNEKVEIVGDNVSIHDVAKWMETIPYEVEISLLLNRKLDRHIARDKSYHKYSDYKKSYSYFADLIEKSLKKVKEKLFKSTSFTSEIVEIREVDSNGWIGYGATEEVTKGNVIATIPLGYSNGIIRSLSNKKVPVYINDIKCNIIGRISMNHTTIKVPKKHKGKIKVDDRVYLLSSNKSHKKLSMNNWAKLTGLKKEEVCEAINYLYYRQ